MFYRKENSQIFSIRHFLIFYDKTSWKSKIDINFQFSISKENWMDEWPTDQISLPFAKLSSFESLISRKQSREIELQIVSAISLGWFVGFGKSLTINQRSSQPIILTNGKHPFSPS